MALCHFAEALCPSICVQPCCPLPQRTLIRVLGTTDHSATLSDQHALTRCRLLCAIRSTDRTSRVATSFILHACQNHYPDGNCPVHLSFASQTTDGLLLSRGGSAPTLLVSRSAQFSLHVPACMLAESPMRPCYPECFNPCRYLHKSL